MREIATLNVKTLSLKGTMNISHTDLIHNAHTMLLQALLRDKIAKYYTSGAAFDSILTS